jgi:hypothetical protein
MSCAAAEIQRSAENGFREFTYAIVLLCVCSDRPNPRAPEPLCRTASHHRLLANGPPFGYKFPG